MPSGRIGRESDLEFAGRVSQGADRSQANDPLPSLDQPFHSSCSNICPISAEDPGSPGSGRNHTACPERRGSDLPQPNPRAAPELGCSHPQLSVYMECLEGVYHESVANTTNQESWLAGEKTLTLSPRSNLGQQAWQQAPLPLEPSCQPTVVLCIPAALHLSTVDLRPCQLFVVVTVLLTELLAGGSGGAVGCGEPKADTSDSRTAEQSALPGNRR